MWLINSSVGRKVVMSLTGLFLILFLTFHMAMNVVAVISAEAYNMIASFLGANWYALIGTLIIAGGAVIHIIYAFWLTLQNRRARGTERYAVSETPKAVEWASQNMLVLGLIVLLGLGLHLAQFWYKMQFAEVIGNHNLGEFGVSDGAAYIQYYFSNIVYVVIYLVWLVALWFHLTHGFWSSLQTLGWSNKIWFERWRVISYIFSTLVVAGFALVVVFYYAKSVIGW